MISEIGFDCFCGERLDSREDLVEHNVAAHRMNEAESLRRVLEKYPE